jgi:signal peptidase I
MKGFIREVLITVGLALVIFFVLQTTIQSSIVVGSSMEPGLQDGQRLIISKAAYHFEEPGRGDIIIFHSPSNYQVDYIKRIIGLPGDTVEVRGGSVFVNGKRLQEPYVKDPPHYNYGPYTVKPDNYFVLGDNRNNSNDSHTNWTVPSESVIGKAWLSIWPPRDWGTVANYSLDAQLGRDIGMQANLLLGQGVLWP